MDLVVDANVLSAALMRRNVTHALLFREDVRCHAPDLIFEELDRYSDEIRSKTEVEEYKFHRLVETFRRRIRMVPEEEIEPFIEGAMEIAPDINDMLYLAAAMSMNIPIWSNDRALKEKQNRITVYSTNDLLKVLGPYSPLER